MYPKTKKLILQKQQAGIFSGAVFCFIQNDVMDTEVIGKAAILPKEEAMTIEHLFDVASLTKVICTTSVILRLWERQEINLDQPLNSYLPAFINKKLTIRHLLTHTSDIQTWINNRDQLNADELRKAYLTLQPGKDLGKVVKYTDAGTILLGFMLEEWYQDDLTTIFQREVLDPLEMKNSYFPPIIDLNKVVPTQQLTNGTVLRGVTHDPKARVLGKHAGNAGLFTNLSDMTKFATAYFGKEFLKASTITELMTDQTPNRKGNRSLGWDLKSGWLFHTGYTGTFILIHPERRESFIFLSNRVHPNDYRETYIQHRDEIIQEFLNETI